MKIILPIEHDKITHDRGASFARIETDFYALCSALDNVEDVSEIVPHRITSEQIAGMVVDHFLTDASASKCINVMRQAVRNGDAPTWEAELVSAYLELGRDLLNCAADNQGIPHLQDLAHKLRMMSGNAINGQVTP